MFFALSVVYGVHVILLAYLICFLAVRGFMGGGAVPFYLTTLKYVIYFLVLKFGFKHLDSSGIAVGMVLGVYLSLPVMYWVNRLVVSQMEKLSEEPRRAS
ncbi:MAG: hypothetical protein HYX41_03135 [Bdellovibrio sp.]|nr:hypothetical protein [Bdellovibrio sp.]